jgi:DNA-binding transcriptional LysR family regulator
MIRKLLSRRGLSFDRLAALLDLADAGSLARAADGDPNRQSLYSRQIKELEHFFGVELTRRRGQTLELTDAGRRVVDICRETFARLDDFQNDCEARPTTVAIGAGSSLFQWLLLPHLGLTRRLFPRHTVRLEDLSTDEVVARLCDMRLDLGLIRDSALVPPLASKRLLKLSYSLFAPRERLPRSQPTEWHAVLETVPLALQATGGQFHRTLEEAASKQRVRLEPALCCVSFTQAARAVLSGQYAAILPSIAVVDLPPDRFLQLPLPLLKTYERQVCLAWNPRQYRLRPSLEKFTAHLVKSLAP